MSLKLIPDRDPCAELEAYGSLDGVSILLNSFVCPLRGASKHQSSLGKECWCNGNVAAQHLRALGCRDEATAMYQDKTADEAKRFGDHLARLVVALRTKYDGHDDQSKPKGAGTDSIWDKARRAIMPTRFATFEQALDAIDDVAGWYRKVGECRSGVVAWS